MLYEAMARYSLAPAETLMIGDSYTDFEAASRANCEFWLVETGKGAAVKASLAQELIAQELIAQDQARAESFNSIVVCRDLTAVVNRLGVT